MELIRNEWKYLFNNNTWIFNCLNVVTVYKILLVFIWNLYVISYSWTWNGYSLDFITEYYSFLWNIFPLQFFRQDLFYIYISKTLKSSLTKRWIHMSNTFFSFYFDIFSIRWFFFLFSDYYFPYPVFKVFVRIL